MKKISKAIIVGVLTLSMIFALFACAGNSNCSCENNTGNTTYNCTCENLGGNAGNPSNCTCENLGSGADRPTINIPDNIWRVFILDLSGINEYQSFKMIRLADSLEWTSITQSEFNSYPSSRRRNNADDFRFNMWHDFFVQPHSSPWAYVGSYVAVQVATSFYRVSIVAVEIYSPTVTFEYNIMTITVPVYDSFNNETFEFTYIIPNYYEMLRRYINNNLISVIIGLARIEFFMDETWL